MTGSLESIRNDPRKKIAIIGKAPSSLGLAPYGDNSWQIWTLSDLVLAKQSPRFDVHFELHEIDQLRGPRKPYLDWLATITDKPLLLREATPELPNGIPFPKDEIVAKYGRYFTNTVSWMIALAIEMQPAKLGVWGVDMACADEYGHQRPSCEYFLGWARGVGVDVYLPPQSDLLKCSGLYGFDVWQSDMFCKWQARCKELNQRVQQRAQERDGADQQVAYLRGCVEYCVDEAKKQELTTQLSSTETYRDKAASETLYLQGAYEDCHEYWGQWAQRT